MKMRLPVQAAGILTLLMTAGSLLANGNVYVSRFWHNHQPIYWPEWNNNGSETGRIQYAWDSIVLKPSQEYGTGTQHPDNNLTDIFGLADRVASYQGRPRDSLSSIGSAGGFAMSYSGSLIEDVRSLGNAGQMGYGGNWYDGNRQASSWQTPSGSPRLDLLGFTYHHSLGAVLPKEVLRKELQAFKQVWWRAWDKNADLSDHSKGFFPTEMAYSREMVDVLVDEGYEWLIVASHHISRTCPTYDNYADPEGSFQIKSSPPNDADQIGPSPTTGWWFDEPNPGQAAWNVSPYAYQLQRVKYVDPDTGNVKSMVAVPSDDVLSYVAGYSGAQVGMIGSKISPYATDPSKPVIVMPSTDGDNAWGGGYDSWMVSTPGFFSGSQGAGYNITAPQDFVNAFAPASNDFSHVEDGAWIFPESGYGSPYFLKWVEPPVDPDSTNRYPNTMVDLETPGYALKFYSWAVVMAGANWCETAEQIYEDEGGTVEAWKIARPWDWDGSSTGPNFVETAWHMFLGGLDSGFNYYGGLGNDDEVKPSLASRRAIETLQTYVDARLTSDTTGPSIFKPQRFPWNPGGYTFGWFNRVPGVDENYLKEMPSEFYIWTHIYDVNDVASANLKIRIDNDGTNPLTSDQNETYAGGAEVGSWFTIPMTMRSNSNDRATLNALADNGQIDYFITSPEVANYYFAKITEASVPGFRGKLLDYYVEATDTRGNTRKSDIAHVFVIDDGQTGGGSSFAQFSSDPRDCAPLEVTYSATNGALEGVSPVYQQISFDQGSNWTRSVMTSIGNDLWVSTNAVPDNAPTAVVWFEDTPGTTTDSNGGANWSTSVRDCDAPTGPSVAAILPESPVGCDPVTIRYYPNEGPLQGATNIFIHIGRNGWADVETPDPAMDATTGTYWEYTYVMAEETDWIDAVFNDGTTWDNNSGLDWQFTVTDCTSAVPPVLGFVVTNPAMDIAVGHAVTSYVIRGVADGVSGHISWSNNLTGESGQIAAVSPFTIPDVPLSVGSNVITVSGTNSGAGFSVYAWDSSTNTAYGAGWPDGGAGGMNWSDGWDLEASGSAGHFIGQVPGNANLDIGSSAFGLWANSGGISEAYRMFAMPLGAGDRFMVDFENNFVAIGQQSVGFDLIDDASNVVIGFSFVGGSNVYNVTDAGGLAATAVGWTDQGNTLQYDFTSGSDFTLTVGANIYTGTYSGSLSGVHVWNADGNSGSDYDLYVDSFQYLEPSGPAGTSNDVVIIYRHPLSDTDGDGIEDSWETANCGGSTNCTPDAQTGDGDEYNYLAEYILDYDPAVSNAPFGFAAVLVDGGIMIEFQDASTNRAYTIDYKSDMTPGIDWMVKQGYIAGTNAYMSFGDMDLSKSSGTYRVRVQLP